MFSPDTSSSSSYGTLGINPISVNSTLHHDYRHNHNRSSISSIASYHNPYLPPQHDLQRHSKGLYTSSNHIAISSFSNPRPNQTPLQPTQTPHPSAATQVHFIPCSTSAAIPASSRPLSLSTTEFDNLTLNTARRNSELIKQQQLLYQDLSQFSLQTATFPNNHATVSTTVGATYTTVTAFQGPLKTSLSNTNGIAAQLGGNGSSNHNNYTNTNTNNDTDTDNDNSSDHSAMSSDLAADGDFIVRALHEYHTDSDGHLSFSQFQYIKVRHCDASGWWFGESENNRGWFPSNRVERVAAVYETEYLSRPTSITSEDYDQIRTGLDGVEIQFLGEPVMESLSDSIHLDWGGVDNSSVVTGATALAPSVGRTKAGQLAFPPTQLSMSQPTYGSEASTDMESEMFYQHAISSATSINTNDISYAYSDFVSEVTLYVMELRDATSKSELERYQPIVAKVFSCVKALLIFTNTIARESPVLATYPELARSRRMILRALGKLYSKCRVANGSQTLTTTRQRQFATEKLGIFSGQVLEGITDFATCAREIGLRIRAEAASAHDGDLEMILDPTGEINTTPPTSNSHGRTRRRVSRANSTKGFKSFNAVRQWKTEHLQRHSGAKKAVEFLLSEYMESLNGGLGTKGMDDVIRTTIQSAQAVEAFLISADDARVRTHFKEDEQYIIHKNQLSSTLMELFEFIHVMENISSVRSPSSEIILNRLMNLASVLLKCLIDLEIPPKAQNLNQELSLLPPKRVSFSQDQHDHPLPASASDEGVLAAEDRVLQQYLSIKPPTASSLKNIASRNTAPARPKQPTTATANQGSSHSRKYTSLNVVSDRHRRQAEGKHELGEMDGAHLNPTAAYGEAHDLERNHLDFYRPSHDSAVVIMSGKNTPHHSLMPGQKGAKSEVALDNENTPHHSLAGQKGAKAEVTIDEEEHPFEVTAEKEELREVRQEREDDNTQGQLSGAIKDAERTIMSLFLPTTGVTHQLAQVDVPRPDKVKQRFSLQVQADPSAELGSKSPPKPVIRPQYSFESKPTTTTAPTRTTRTTKPFMDNLAPSRTARNQPRAPGMRSEQVFEDMESEQTGMIGLGLSIPTGARPKISSVPHQGAGAGSIPRPSGIARARSPISGMPTSPRLEPSKRVPRRDPSPHPHNPSLNSDSRITRTGGYANANLAPGVPPSSRRGSEHSIRSEMSLPRKSSDSQAMRENEPRLDYQDRRQQQHQHQQQYHQQQQQSNQAGGRRGSKASLNSSALRAEMQGARDDNVLSGLATPASPNIQTFLEGQGARRSAKTQRRESVLSNLSVATESSVHSRSVGRPLSPSQRSRNNQQQDANSIRGRVSTESTMSNQQQQQQPSRGAPSPTSHRAARQARTVSNRTRTSGEFKHESNATPWFLGDDYEPEEVHYNENGTLVAATLEAFIEMLTSHKNTPDAALVMTFFTTFRLFTSPLELTELLIKRFMRAPPSELSEQEIVVWTQQKQERVQKRVHIAFKTWLEGYWVSEKDREAFRPITEFVTHEMKKTLPGPAGRLLDMLTQWGNKRRSLNLGGRSQTISKARSHDRLNQVAQDQQKQADSANGTSSSSSKQFATVKDKSRKGLGALGGRESTNNRGPPAPAITKALMNALSNDQTMAKVPVTDIKAVELARQITILVSKLYADIPYLELLNKDRPNCSRMIQVSNKITEWLIETVVDEQDVKRRVVIVKHWIEVGEECLRMNNFDTLMAITNGIESTPVSRLYNTWEGINKVYLERFLQLKKAISSEANYSGYRNKLKTVTVPCIPFLGLYFKAITYIEDGNSAYKEFAQAVPSQQTSAGGSHQVPPQTPLPVPTRKLLRYGRFHQLAKAVQEFRGFQSSYELLEVPRLRDYIMKCMEDQDPERSYTKSLAIEPRRPVPSHMPGAPLGKNGNQRASGAVGGNKGLFHGGVSNSEMNNGSVPVKLNKLSFFRKSLRTERS